MGRRQALVVALALAAAVAGGVALRTTLEGGPQQVADDPVVHPSTRPMIMVPVR